MKDGRSNSFELHRIESNAKNRDDNGAMSCCQPQREHQWPRAPGESFLRPWQEMAP